MSGRSSRSTLMQMKSRFKSSAIGRVLETLVGHHVAPVAGRIAHREEDRLLLARGPAQRFRAPRLPIDGVRGMLQQVRADFVGKLVHTELYGTSPEKEFLGVLGLRTGESSVAFRSAKDAAFAER